MIKLKFKKYIQEYRKAPMPDSFDKVELRNFLRDEDNLVQLRTHTGIPNEKAIVIFEYSFDLSNKVFILANRQDYDDIAGYMFIKKSGQYWQVLSIEVFTEYRNKGLGIDLYVKIIQSGYDLINGYSLSNEAEKIWVEKLPKFVNINIINMNDGKIEKFSDKPTKDNVANDKQQWFYLATSKSPQLEGLNENVFKDRSDNIAYERWLRNDPSYKMTGFRSAKYGQDGDF